MNQLSRVLCFTLLMSSLMLPVFANAQTAGSADQISSLIAQIKALQQAIQSVGSTAQSTSVSTSSSSVIGASTASSSPTTCPTLIRTLDVGASGGDVLQLQTFLLSQGAFSGIPTGYFGTLTQLAVQTWQSQQGIVSTGDASTGFGVVGPRTRSAIVQVCQTTSTTSTTSGSYPQGRPTSCPIAPPPTMSCSTTWQANTDAWGCTTSYKCSIPLQGSGVVSGQSPSCPSVPVPACSGKLVSVGTSASGCNLGYTCTVASSITCPQYTTPNCQSGYVIQSGGTDTNGCVLPSQCVQSTPHVCPMYTLPTCPAGSVVQSSGLDSYGCALVAQCMQSTPHVCPVYALPTCPLGSVVQTGGTDTYGCSIAPTCVVSSSSH